jgi:hypothetical protein
MIFGLYLTGSVVEVVALNLLMRCGIGGGRLRRPGSLIAPGRPQSVPRQWRAIPPRAQWHGGPEQLAAAVVPGNGGKAERDQRSHDHRGRPVRAPAAPCFERATRFKIDWDIPGDSGLTCLLPSQPPASPGVCNSPHNRSFPTCSDLLRSFVSQ